MSSLDPQFKHRKCRYILQVSIATVALFVIFWLEHLVAGAEVARAVQIGAIASTAFILFVSPHRPTAMPTRVLGGHGWAIVVASIMTLMVNPAFSQDSHAALYFLFSFHSALAVGLSMLAMAITNTEHAPAAGTALAIIGNGFDWQLVFFAASSVLMLSAIHWLLRRYLIDLY